MSDMLQHKGYYGSVEYSADDEIFFGRTQFIRDLVSYEATDATSLKAAFAEAVEDYLEQCAEQGRQPDQPVKETFNVRIGAELHRRAALAPWRLHQQAGDRGIGARDGRQVFIGISRFGGRRRG